MGPAYDAEQSSLGCGDNDQRDVVLSHAAQKCVEGFVGANGCGTRLHNNIDRDMGRGRELLRTEAAQHDSVFVDDHTSIRVSSWGHVADQIVRSARHDGADQCIQCSWWCWVTSHRWLAGGEPVGLAERVVVGLEPKSLEPPRGPRGQVSKTIPAVHDDRPGQIEDGGRAGAQ